VYKRQIHHGCAVSARVPAEEVVEVPGVGGRAPRVISRQVLAAIIEPRAEEILMLILQELDRCGATDLLGAGVVMTGGSSLLPGMVELAERVLGIPARIGVPRAIEGLPEGEGRPGHAVALGLLLHGAETERGRDSGRGFLGLFRRPREWVREYL
ncbi:MAG: rod shape-determining protein, partial [Candidatus Eisenbacteria bacterium]|nr:rod shape-determining protein [Candidatus Eisenbacteria bacterium]